MTINRKYFFDAVRTELFGGSLTQGQVDGMNAILDEAERRRTTAPYLAYMLATAKWETAHKMLPNTENLVYTTAERIRAVWPSRFPSIASALPFARNPVGLANKVYNGRMGNRMDSNDGWTFRGRGYVHLTGRDNYERASAKLGINLIKTPQAALLRNVAVQIMFDGMTAGWFTGARLGSFLDRGVKDYFHARRVINGLDNATAIAVMSKKFERAIRVEVSAPSEMPLSTGTPPILSWARRLLAWLGF